jgi:hypothetical protein
VSSSRYVCRHGRVVDAPEFGQRLAGDSVIVTARMRCCPDCLQEQLLAEMAERVSNQREAPRD